MLKFSGSVLLLYLVRPRWDDVDDGLRRSKRTRVLPLQTHLSERIRYERRKSGLVIVGIDPPIIPDDRIRRKNSGKHHDRKSRCRSMLLWLSNVHRHVHIRKVVIIFVASYIK